VTEHFGLILDILVVCLLGATIFYAATLSRRLTQLRHNRAELEAAARGLAEAAGKADAGIKGLRLAADDSGARLQRQIDRAQELRDELAFLVDAGESLAARLESAARGRAPAPGEGRPERPKAAPAAAAGAPDGASGSRAGGARGAPQHGQQPGPQPGPQHGQQHGQQHGSQHGPQRRGGANDRRPDSDLIEAIENMR